MRLRTLTAVALLASLLTAAGCSSGNKNGSNLPNNGGNNGGNQGANNTTTLPDCPTSAAISTALGITYGELATTSTAKERNCLYSPSSVETGLATLHFEILPGAGDFAAVKAGYSAGRTVSDVSGLGDEAFLSVLSAGPAAQNTMAARKGSLMVLLSSYASADKEKAFIATTLG